MIAHARRAARDMLPAMDLAKAGRAPWTFARWSAAFTASATAAAIASLAACGSGDEPAAPDAGPDGPPACAPQVLLAGGSDVAAQGWTPITQPPFALTYGADYTRLETTTTAGQSAGGQLLLSRPGLVPTSAPFAIAAELMIEAVTSRNGLDASVAILPSLSGMFGSAAERAQMIYLEGARLGWADDSAAAALLDGAYHTVVVARDAAGAATVTLDGAQVLTRASLPSNGTFAIGDQTNDRGVDATVRIRKVTLLCL